MQRDVGRGAACRVSRPIEERMTRDATDGDGLPGLEDLDAHIGRDTMRSGEHQVARQRRAGAEIAARIDHHDDGASRKALRRRRLAGDGKGGRAQGKAGEGGEGRAHDLRMSLGAADLSTLDVCGERLECRMTHNNSEYQEHQLKRWTRPDAHRFVRPDWRRHVRPGFERDHPFALYEQKYDPNQPRVPAGDPAGGQWTSDSSSGGLPTRQLQMRRRARARTS